MSRFLHTPPLCPRTDWANDFGRPWWKNDNYCIGFLSQKTRNIRIINTLTSQEQILEVITLELFSLDTVLCMFPLHVVSKVWNCFSFCVTLKSKTLYSCQFPWLSSVFFYFSCVTSYTLGIKKLQETAEVKLLGTHVHCGSMFSISSQ